MDLLLRGLACLMLMGAAAPVAAAQLAIDGDWGDASGCAYTRGQEGYDIDNMMLLKSDWISGYIFSCEIASVATAASGAHLVSGICHAEGTTDSLDIRHFTLRPLAGEEALEVFFEDGIKWGEVRPC